MKKIKEPMPPSKSMNKPGKKTSGIKYAMKEEKFDNDSRKKVKRTNHLAEDLMKSKEGYSKEPRVKAQKKKAMR